MRFLVDESTGPWVAQWLREQGHEVFSVFEQSRGINDEDIIQKAFADFDHIQNKSMAFYERD